MTGMQAFFSVVIPVFNKESTLAGTIQSVLAQSYPHFELILVLDPSKDNSEQVARSFPDPRIKIINRDKPGPGGYEARNRGIAEATTGWIAFLDADDTWDPEYLVSMHAAIHQNADVTVFASGYDFLRKGVRRANAYYSKYKGAPSHRFDLKRFLWEKPLWTSVIVVKRESIISCGGFPEGRYSRGGDQETWFRLMVQERKGFWVNRLSAVYNTDADNMVTKTIRFDVTTHPLFNTIQQALLSENDTQIQLAMKKHWNATAFNYFKNMAKQQVIKPATLINYYFWDRRIMKFKVVLFFVYSWKNMFASSK